MKKNHLLAINHLGTGCHVLDRWVFGGERAVASWHTHGSSPITGLGLASSQPLQDSGARPWPNRGSTRAVTPGWCWAGSAFSSSKPILEQNILNQTFQVSKQLKLLHDCFSVLKKTKPKQKQNRKFLPDLYKEPRGRFPGSNSISADIR